MFRLDDKTALVTGAGSGIGREIALLFARQGAHVAVADINDAGAGAVVGEITQAGGNAFAAHLDVSDVQSAMSAVATAKEATGRLDILVNNAGIGPSDGPLHQTSFAVWDRVIRTNLHGPFLCSREAARRMVERGTPGRIVNISSVHEESCALDGGAYCVSKAGLRNLTRTMAIELGAFGITVNDVAPGMIMTRMNPRARDDAAHLAWAEAQIPIKRAGQPADIANMVLFLCSDAGSYCTGSTHFVDGGWMLTWPPV